MYEVNSVIRTGKIFRSRPPNARRAQRRPKRGHPPALSKPGAAELSEAALDFQHSTRPPLPVSCAIHRCVGCSTLGRAGRAIYSHCAVSYGRVVRSAAGGRYAGPPWYLLLWKHAAVQAFSWHSSLCPLCRQKHLRINGYGLLLGLGLG